MELQHAAKDLFSPITKATDDQTKKQEQIANDQSVLTTKLDKKQTLLANSLHVDSLGVNKELIERISKQAEIQKDYADAVLKQVEAKVDEKTKETLENISKTAEELRDDVMRVRTANANEIQSVKERIVEQGENLKDLHNEIVTEKTATSKKLQKHTEALDEIQEALKKDVDDISSTESSTTKGSPSPSPVVGPSPSASSSQVPNTDELKKKIVEKLKPSKFRANRCTKSDLVVINQAIDNLKAHGKDIPANTYTKNRIRELYDKSFGAGEYKKLVERYGLGLKDKDQDMERMKLLLASHQAGNSAGVNEFMELLKKLLKQNEISKSDYDKFLEQWST